MSSLDLSDVPTAELARILQVATRGRLGVRLDEVGLRSSGLAVFVAVLRPVFGAEVTAFVTMLELVLAERRRAAGRVAPELVFTRTGTSSSLARDTAAVFRELCDEAEHELFVAGYSFVGGDEVLAAMSRAITRGVRTRVVLDCSQWEPSDGVTPDEVLENAKTTFLAGWRTHGVSPPELWYDPSTCEREFRFGRWKSVHSMHAKCMVADGLHALIGSANFTRRAAQDNLEVGVVIHEREFVQKLLGQWDEAINEKVIRKIDLGSN